MKKIIVCILCILTVCTLPLAVFAQGELPAEKTALTDTASLVSEKFEQWVLPHIEEISVIATLIVSGLYQIRKNKMLSRSLALMNNNTVSIVEQSSELMNKALTNIENASGAVTGYDERIGAVLEAFRNLTTDHAQLESELAKTKEYLRVSAKANLEFSNELAELLNLANIPSFKKEEIGARHLAAVNAIRNVSGLGEVTADVGEKA